MKAEVDTCKANGTRLVYTFHDIVDAKTKGNDVTTADFNGLIDYIAAQVIPVKTMQQVLRASAA
ncbi:hypothetical protein M8J71_11670 [Pseudarthrobacter sp. R1]|uniref:hypothetical protein n=1 Tax=Pseudarthrobacter sp. R1 TaxID=2944934 RepID=UPI00210ED538|nr:hypothetical protein [Pseudarthrobacter sp. R1]MCQ6271140.1 hypothetical protein [Pseudarthrobacter sp. R1]